jgi:Emfourin
VAASDDIHVSFTRSGGVGGMTITGDFDSRELPPEDAQSLRDLVEAADFFAQPSVLEKAGKRPDQIEWEVTVEAAGRRHTARFTQEGPESAAMRELTRYLLGLLRRRATAES